MKTILLISSLILLSVAAQAEDEKVKLQKGAAVEYCTSSSPNVYFVRGSGEQREVNVTVSYSDAKVNFVVEPPYSVGGATVIQSQTSTNTYCYILTKQ